MRTVLTFMLVVLAGCDTAAAGGGDYVCTNAPGIANPTGGLHGAACAKNSDCKYGVCNKVAMQLAGHVTTTEGVCSKDCSCGGATSQCSVDDTGGAAFTCIRATSGGGAECAVKCSLPADCTPVNPRFNACVDGASTFSSGVKVCAIQ